MTVQRGLETGEGWVDKGEEEDLPLAEIGDLVLPIEEGAALGEFFAAPPPVMSDTDGDRGRLDTLAELRRRLDGMLRPDARSEAALTRAAQAGDMAARNRLVEQHVWVVLAVAKEYEASRLPREDLVQEGIFGLTRAIETFDPERGTRFSTYGKYWVQDAIKRAIVETSRTVGLPRELYRRFFRVRRARDGLVQRLQRDPSSAEVGAEVALSAAQVEEVEALFASVAPLDRLEDGGDDADDQALAEGRAAIPHKSETRPTLEVEEPQIEHEVDLVGRYSAAEVDAFVEHYPVLYPKASLRPAAIVRLIDIDKALRRMPFEHWQTVTHAVMRSCAAIEVAELLAIDRETVARRRKSAVAWIVQYLNSGDELAEVAPHDLIWRGWFDDGVGLLPVAVKEGNGDAALIPRSLREAKTLCRRRPAAPTSGSDDRQPV